MAKLDDHLPYALRQFDTELITTINVFGFDLLLTTASMAKITTAGVIVAYLLFAIRERAMVPSRLQLSAELIYEFVSDTVTRVAGAKAKRAIPFIFTLFVFVLFGSLLGMTPIKETFTAHLLVALGLSFLLFAYVNVVAFRVQGLSFFRHFLPTGIPIFVAPVFVLIEAISYLFRPITLGFRLFVNIVAGHVMLKLFADFCTMMISAMGAVGVLASIGPVIVMAVLYAFEVMIVCIQAYIFILLSCVYLGEALKEH